MLQQTGTILNVPHLLKRWTVAIPYNAILLSNEKETIINKNNNVYTFQMHYNKGKKQDSKGFMLCDSICMAYYKKQKYKK